MIHTNKVITLMLTVLMAVSGTNAGIWQDTKDLATKAANVTAAFVTAHKKELAIGAAAVATVVAAVYKRDALAALFARNVVIAAEPEVASKPENDNRCAFDRFPEEAKGLGKELKKVVLVPSQNLSSEDASNVLVEAKDLAAQFKKTAKNAVESAKTTFEKYNPVTVALKNSKTNGR